MIIAREIKRFGTGMHITIPVEWMEGEVVYVMQNKDRLELLNILKEYRNKTIEDFKSQLDIDIKD